MLLAFFLYIKGKKISSLLIFFFFVSLGFQLIPEEAMNLGIGFSKGTDYAVILILACFIYDLFTIKNYLKPDPLLWILISFFAFLAISVIYSKFYVGASWNEIIRTIRQFVLFLSFLIFRQLKYDEIERLMKYLFTITTFLSFIYLCQSVFSEKLLQGFVGGKMQIGEFKLIRYYNQPLMLHLFAIMAVFKNPFKGSPKFISSFLLIASIFMGFHRSLTGFFILILIIGFVLGLSRVRQVRIFVVSLAILLPTIAVVGNNFVKSSIYKDLQSVWVGNFADTDFDLDDLAGSTFAFRIGHLFERMKFLSESPVRKAFGAGLITEDSKLTDGMFDFAIGIHEELTGRAVQLESPDISYSPLIIRYGYLGGLIFLNIYFYLLYFFYKKRHIDYGLVGLLLLILSFLVSFFSDNLLQPINYALFMLLYAITQKREEYLQEQEIISKP